jgi:oligopeptide/dipeptide ABC transporter ATP-binding protein
MSIVFITHDIGVAAEIADRIAVMYAGRIVESGPADEVIRRPLHPYTRALMDAVPSIERRAARLTQIPGAPPRLGQVIKGCSFHPRCPVAHESCWREQPPRLIVGAAEVECVLYEAPAARQTKAAGER